MRVALAVAASALLAGACAPQTDDLDDGAIEVFGPYRGVEADAFTASFDDFTARTGVDVLYVGSSDFVADLRSRVTSGDPPDVAVVPQPALIDELIDANAVVPLDDPTRTVVADAFGEVSALGDDAHGDLVVPFRTTIKSLVWFRPDVFERNDWEVPSTIVELDALVDEIASEGELAPWCLGVRSGVATGWPATDWIEDLLLRTGGADGYDQVLEGSSSADEPLSVAIDAFDALVGEREVFGLRRSAPRIDIDEAVSPLFADGGCAMFKQADFALSWMPGGVEVGVDVDAFVLPGVSADEVPVVIGGDGVVQLTSSPGAAEVVGFLASSDGAAPWAARGGYLSPRTDVDRSEYFHPNAARLLELVEGATIVRFDASDRMDVDQVVDRYLPAVTGWLAGAVDADALVSEILDLTSST